MARQIGFPESFKWRTELDEPPNEKWRSAERDKAKRYRATRKQAKQQATEEVDAIPADATKLKLMQTIRELREDNIMKQREIGRLKSEVDHKGDYVKAKGYALLWVEQHRPEFEQLIHWLHEQDAYNAVAFKEIVRLRNMLKMNGINPDPHLNRSKGNVLMPDCAWRPKILQVDLPTVVSMDDYLNSNERPEPPQTPRCRF